MIENNKNNIKYATNRDQTNLVINRAVVESYTSKRKNKIINENENNNKIQKNNINIQNTNKSKYSLCPQLNFYLSSHIKHFDLPLSISISSLNYLMTLKKKENKDNNKENKDNNQENKDNNKDNENIGVKTNSKKKEESSLIKNYTISSSNIFIIGGQNLKDMRIHLSHNKNNIVHKEINDCKNSKNKIIEKVDINLSDNKNKKDQLLTSLEIIKKRWKEVEKEYKIRLSYISNNENIILNKNQYIDELVNKIYLNSNINSSSIKKNNQNNYILIKQDKQNNNYHLIHEIISPKSSKELETFINKFINQNNDNNNNKENIHDYNDKENIHSNRYNMSTYNKRTSQNNIYLNNEMHNSLKKSKFEKPISQDDDSNESSKDYINNDISIQNDYFNPIFILSQQQIKNLSEILDKKTNHKTDKKKFSINHIISINYKENKEQENLKQSKKEKLNDLNFNIHPIKVDKFEFIHINKNKNDININNIDLSNIAQNQSEYTKQLKAESEDSYQKIKETEDFGQSTPLSLLQEKYFIYAVSKWAKYSIINQQSQIYIKFSYKSGHPKFDPILLDMTNFTLWIEKIQTKKERKSSIVTSSSSHVNNNIDNKSTSKLNYVKNKNYKTGASIFLNESNNNKVNHIIKKKSKSKSKPKIDKKKQK